MDVFDRFLASDLALPGFGPGAVWLVGAGPGDPGLVSVLALGAIRRADAIVYDALVGPEILSAARPEALLEFAGKRGGVPSPAQPDISRRLVELARAGHRVVRLKGGDPLVFGRGGEEALALVEAGIPFRIVPGITAAIGGLAYAGIPLTHRTVGQAVTFVTGSDASGRVPARLDWAALARSPVLICYMGLGHLAEIAGRLLAAGRNPAEPVALISRATLPDQAIVISTLGAVVDEAPRHRLKAPVLIAIGEVVGLRDGLDWLAAARAGGNDRPAITEGPMPDPEPA